MRGHPQTMYRPIQKQSVHEGQRYRKCLLVRRTDDCIPNGILCNTPNCNFERGQKQTRIGGAL